MSTTAQCWRCVHYLGSCDCEAYPDGIPEPILSGDADHRLPYRGDQGILFVPGEPKMLKVQSKTPELD